MRHAVDVAGDSALATRLRMLLADAAAYRSPMLVNADSAVDATTVIDRCRAYEAALKPGTEASIVTLLSEPRPGLADLAHHTSNAALLAFTRQAALAWAPRRIRVNAIGLAASPAGPFEPQEQSGRAAVALGEVCPSVAEADIVRTICAIAAWPSMTGQIIRLGKQPALC